MKAETVYSAAAQLRDPVRFADEAGRDLRLASSIGWRLFTANMKIRHRRALLGYAWLVLPAVLMTFIWVFLQRQKLVDVGPVGMSYPVYVLSGMVLWQFFLDMLNAPLNQLNTARIMVARSRVPLEAHLCAGVLEAATGLAVRLLVLAPVLVAFDSLPGATFVYVPLGLAALALLGFALGMLLAPFGLLYDDVGRVVGLATGIWFFLTPIVYRMPEEGLVRMNPVAPLLDSIRGWLTGAQEGAAVPAGLVPILAATLPLLLAAYILLRLARPHLAARLG